MISKKVDISPQNDNYARLAEYIADAGHEGEKSLMRWCAGCLGDDDYQNGIAEAMDVQAINVRTTKNKTYHLVISFRLEDEAKIDARRCSWPLKNALPPRWVIPSISGIVASIKTPPISICT